MVEIRRFPFAHDTEAELVIKTAYDSLSDKSWFAVDPDGFLESDPGHLYKAYVDGNIAGILTMAYPGVVYRELCVSEPSADMDIAAVLPVYRGKGLMKALLREAAHDAEKDGIKILFATVHPQNIFSRRAFEAAEFDVICRKAMYGGFDRLLMMRRIG